ncbi:MAG: hypothetical protein JNM95_05740 [Chitinophagaceae bacterium]|nr:hypothetical protein [Chitinophagaceae bacterium]
MALLDLNSIRNVSGVEGTTCPNCGAELVRDKEQQFWQQLVKVMSLSFIRIYTLTCKNCGKKYRMM